jgi:hypothetical protein
MNNSLVICCTVVGIVQLPAISCVAHSALAHNTNNKKVAERYERYMQAVGPRERERGPTRPSDMSALSSFSRKRKLQQRPATEVDFSAPTPPTQDHDHDAEQALASSQLEPSAPTERSQDHAVNADFASSELEQGDAETQKHDTSSCFNPFAAFAADKPDSDITAILNPLSGSPVPLREKRAKLAASPAAASPKAAAKKQQQRTKQPPLTRIVKAHPAPQRDSTDASSKPKAPSLLTAFFSGGSGSAPKPASSSSNSKNKKGKKDKEGCLDPDDLDNMQANEREACTRKWQLMADKDAPREVQRFQVKLVHWSIVDNITSHVIVQAATSVVLCSVG